MDSCASADGGDSDDDFLESSNGNGVPECSSPCLLYTSPSPRD